MLALQTAVLRMRIGSRVSGDEARRIVLRQFARVDRAQRFRDLIEPRNETGAAMLDLGGEA